MVAQSSITKHFKLNLIIENWKTFSRTNFNALAQVGEERLKLLRIP